MSSAHRIIPQRSVRIPAGTWRAAKQQARQDGCSMSQGVRPHLAHYVAGGYLAAGTAREARKRSRDLFHTGSLSVPHDEWEAAKQLAAQDGLKIGTVVTAALHRYAEQAPA